MSDQNDNRTNGAAPPNGAGTPWAPPTPAQPPAPPAPTNRRSNGGVRAGLFLIVLGLIFLAGQMLPGVAWWNLWPLLIVLVGVIQMFTPSHGDDWGPERIMDGLGTVIIGVIFLGNTLGIVSWTMWWTFITLWPVLIVALGVSILGKGLQQSWLRMLSPLLVWATLAYAVAVSFTGAAGLQPVPMLTKTAVVGEPFAYSEPVGDTSAATLVLKGGAGDITVRGGDALIDASGTTPFGTPDLSVTRSGQNANVDLTLGSSNGTVVVPGVGGAKADVALSRTTVWDATMETGATSLDADLSDVPLRRLTLKTGASSATVKLGEVPQTATSTDVSIKAGVSSIEVFVPRGSAVRVDTHNGLSATDVDSSLRGMGAGVWQSAGYGTASKTINVSVESGISSISVRTY